MQENLDRNLEPGPSYAVVYFVSQRAEPVLSVLSKAPGNPSLTTQTDLLETDAPQYFGQRHFAANDAERSAA